MIKTVFFDFDGVLTLEGSGTDSTCEALAIQKNLPYEDLKPIVRPYLKKLAVVPDTYESILDSLNNELHTDITVNELLDAAKSTRPNLGMYALAEEIRTSGLDTGIITDNPLERMKLVDDEFAIGDFNPVVVSAEVGSGKWQGTDIFQRALQAAGVDPHEAVFIDNTEENLIPANELGIHTYWHDHHLNNQDSLRAWLQGLGVQV